MARIHGQSRRTFSFGNQPPRTAFRFKHTGRFLVAVTCTADVATGGSYMLQSRCCVAHAAQHPRAIKNAVPAGVKQSCTVLAVGADGNCMFRALAQSRSFSQDGRVLTNQEEGAEAAKLRKGVVEEMQRHKDILSLFVTQDWDSYMRRMAQSGTWGGEPELSVAPRVLGAPVQVYQASSRRGGKVELITEYEGLGEPAGGGSEKAASASKRSCAPIPVVFYGQHYDALLDENLKPAVCSEL